METKKKEIQSIYPLSPMQVGMLFHSIKDRELNIYFRQAVTSISGKLEVELFEKSFEVLLERYEILRTVFVYEKVNQPVQVVLKMQSADISFKDISHYKEGDKQLFIREFRKKDRERGFDLSKDILLRIAIFQTDRESYKVLWSFNHILMDGWCLGILMQDFFQIYSSLKNNKALKLEKVYPYSNYIKWVEGQDKEEAGSYWGQYLADYEQQTTFPKLRKSSTSGEYRQQEFTFAVDEATTKMLEKTAIANQVTLSTVFQSIWGIILQRYNNTGDAVFGSVVSGRPEDVVGVDTMVGLFINTIPVRIRCNDDMSFSTLIKQIQQGALVSEKYSYFPLYEIQGNTALKNELIDNIIVFENFPIGKSLENVGDRYGVGFTINDFEMIEQTNYDLNVVVIPGNELKVRLNYNATLYSEDVIKGIGEHFKEIAKIVASNPAIPVKEIDILTVENKKRILLYFNTTEACYPENKSVCQLFEAQVQKTPDKVAVVYCTGDFTQNLTYRQLNEKANQLARTLIKEESKIIAIMAERSLEMVIAILGVMKSGNAYLPIDPEYPPERIRYILEDSGVRILLTHRHLVDRAEFNGEAIILEEDSLYTGDASNLDIASKPEDLAYVIYTSGTTGLPKGVQLQNRGLVNYAAWFANKAGLTVNDKTILLSSYAFDLGYTSLYPSLLSGCELHITPREMYSDPERLLGYINSNGITYIKSTPSMFNLIVNAYEFSTLCKSLRLVVLGGEQINLADVEKFHNLYPQAQVMNHYGPTEATVGCISQFINFDRFEEYKQFPTIGKPINNTHIYIVDKSLRPVPIGAIGEICIAGVGLARGYLNRPELDAEKFICSPFTEIREERIYRTGDSGRYLPDGSIEFLGRIDHQVKIRGYRVEPGEIENRLLGYEAIKEVVVVARENESQIKILCAYFVSDKQMTVAELREYLAKDLPDYMIPSYFMQLERMPLTPNGKVDRKALPLPQGSINTGAEYIPPRNEIEEKLATIWQEVLGTSRVGINDSFFDLGGDSIKAIQVMSRLYKHKLKIELKDLFKYPRIRELSGCVNVVGVKAKQEIVEGEVGLTPIQTWLFEQEFEYIYHRNQSIMLYKREGFDEGSIRKVFSKIVEHHDALRMVVRKEGSKLIQFNREIGCELFTLDVVYIDDSEDSTGRIEQEANNIQSSIDLTNGPLVKLGLFKTSSGDHLLIVIHHLVVDGVSWRIILQDFAEGYEQAGEEIKLQDKTDSFMEWSKRIKAYADSRTLLREKGYWKSIEDMSITPLKKDFSVAENKVKNGATLHWSLPLEDTEKLLKQVNQAYNTEINDILLTALGLAVRKWIGEERILVNLEGHGRQEIESGINITRTVGWFTSIYPVVLDMSGEEVLSMQIRRVKEDLRHIPNKGIGYGILKYITSQQNKQGIKFNLNPEINFNYLGQLGQDVNTNQFQLSQMPMGEAVNPELERRNGIDINCMVVGGSLTFTFNYNSLEYYETTIQGFVEAYKQSLHDIISHCTGCKETLLTPTDLGDNELSIQELEDIKKEIGKEIQKIYSLSPMQEGMLFHSLMDTHSSAYFQQVTILVEGQLDVKLFERSFNALIERYDILRTVFVYENTRVPKQVVLKRAYSSMYFEDISGLEEGRKTAFIEEFKKKDKEKGFELTKDILMRMSILKTGEKAYRLVWSHHHMLMDGWCLRIISAELMQIYNSLKFGNAPTLERVQPYSDYINWIEKQDRQAAAQYWKQYLQGYETYATLPKLRNLGDGYVQEEVVVTLTESLTKGLSNVAKDNSITLNTIFQAIWGVLLQRYNNVEDVVFGSVVSGRPSEIEGIERMVGLFINTIPVRISCTRETPFLTLIKSVQQHALESERYDYYPLAEIQSSTALKQGLIDHLVIFENYPVEREVGNTGHAAGFSMVGAEVFEQTNYEFDVVVMPGNELTVKLRYNGLTYGKATVEAIGQHLTTAICEIVQNPEVVVGKLEILPEEKKREVLYIFNNTYTEYPKDKTINELFEAQVERTPNSTALIFGDERLTYSELNTKANQLARELRQKGVKPDDIVAISVERSLNMLIGIMAVLKAGGAYLPLDPEYPEERTKYILEDSGARMLLVGNEYMRSIQDMCSIHTLGISEQSLYIGDDTNPNVVNKPSNLAYVIYTSGSTGKPKGVMIEHRAVNNFMKGITDKIEFLSGKTILALTTMSFDIFVLETLLPLTQGLAVVIADENQQRDANALSEVIIKNNIDMLQTTPSRLQLLMSGIEDLICLKGLQEIMVGGEAFPDALLGALKTITNAKIYNMYGPTETTVWSAVRDLTEADKVDIGKPIANTQIYIVDKNNNPQPIGIAGEICVAGDGLARGYFNRPELTTERFIPNPFCSNQLMYKTGDLGRWLPDGNIECLGRVDHQVKIRGFRIELGEIEACLLEHESVNEAAVIANEDSSGNKYLCAYITSDEELSVQQLREHLLKTLPDYMIPSYFITLKDMPLTPNGKVDRRVLIENEPNPSETAINTGSNYTAPRSDIERKLVEIWKQILGIERIGIDDNFFELGGHSLKATILASRIHKEFNVQVPLREIFKIPSIRKIAEYIRDAEKNIFISIEPANDRDDYPKGCFPVTSAQKRMFIVEQYEGIGASYNMPGAVLIEGKLDVERIEKVFTQLVKRHEALRTSFEYIGGEPAQRIHEDVEFHVDYANIEDFAQPEQADKPLEDKIRHVIRCFVRPFDLSKAPLLRVSLVNIGDDKHLLLFDMHHIISDGTSMGVLVKEFASIYEGKTQSELRIQYKDFTEWQNRLFDSEYIKRQEVYWVNRFKTIPILNIPTDYPRPPMQSFEGNRVSFDIGKDLTHQMRNLALETETTMNMVLLAIYNVLLYKYTGQEDIVVGSGVAGRPNSDLENIIGMFVNSLAMRNSPEGGKSFKEFLEDVKESSLEVYENQDYQFEKLVEKLELHRDLSRQPMFDVAFILGNVDIPETQLEGLKLTTYRDEFNTSKYDITLYAREDRDTISCTLEYCTKLFKKETIEGMLRRFVKIAEAAVSNKDVKIKDIDILSEEEKGVLLFDFNSTEAGFAGDETLHELFEEQVEKTPDNVAVIFEAHKLTYRQLNESANRLAVYLSSLDTLKPDSPVGIFIENPLEQVIAMLGILKAGGAYIPIDARLPEERVKTIINDASIGVIVSSKKNIKVLNRLQWECEVFNTFLCIDSEDVYSEHEMEMNALMDEKLWEYVGESSTDDIEGGGWSSSYTGESLSREEMDEYAENTFKKLEPYLHSGARVLEIGCASGISMFRIAPRVGLYYGTDLSGSIIEKDRQRVLREGIKNIRLAHLPAHDINKIEEKDFDIIIMNSVIQAFHGHNYLRQVIASALSLMNDNGILYIGDVMDQDKKYELLQSLLEFKRQHPESRTKIDVSSELFVARGFFEDLRFEMDGIKQVHFSNKIHTIENELTKFRYDTIIEIDKQCSKSVSSGKHKLQHGLDYMLKCEEIQVKNRAKPHNLAYIIYTSGTTGKPKGVMIEHRSISQTIQWRRREYGLNSEDCVLQLFSYSFDGFLTSFFTPIISGASVVLLDSEKTKDPAAIRDCIVTQKVTHFIIIPTLYSAILEYLSPEELKHLRVVTLAGEKATTSVISQSEEKNANLELVNEYGPTESAVVATVFRKMQKQFAGIIGRPVANTQIYILSENNTLQPIGVSGELCISGSRLARGYLNRPELTAEKFIPNLFQEGERLYRTGDLARWLPDGNIEFLGRKDYQVKIRGFRIELGEIEARLLEHELVKDALVLDREEASGSKYLCAFVVGEDKLAIQEIREYLSRELPEYMVPAQFIQLEELPLTPNGKVDRKALVEISKQTEPQTDESNDTEYEAPRNEVEEKLVNIWQDVLGAKKVGINENFFDLGGDSIKAIQVSARLHKFGYSMEIKDLFQNPKISELGRYIKVDRKEAYQGVVEGEVKLTPIQSWFFEQDFTDMHHFNQSVMLYRKSGFDEAIIRKILDKIAQHHDALRMNYKVEHKTVVQLNRGLDGQLYDMAVIDLTGEDGYEDKIKQQAVRLQSSIDLTNGPLLKAGLFKTLQGDHLLLAVHHLVMDGVSWRIIFEDFTAGYKQAISNEEIKLQEKTDSFKEWANRLNAYASGKEILREVEYWGMLEEVALLPKDSSISEDKIIDNGVLSITLSHEETEKLLNSVNRAYNTEINDILLTALALAVKDFTNQNRVLINLEGHGREEIIKEIDITRTVGWFTSAYPVMMDVSAPESYSTEDEILSYRIRKIKETLRRIPNKGIGYGILKYLSPKEHKSSIRFDLKPEISFNYLGQFDRDIETGVFSISHIPTGANVSPNSERKYVFDINGGISEGKLVLRLNYNKHQYNETTVSSFIEGYNKRLLEIIDHCIKNHTTKPTPSDLGDSKLSIEELEGILNTATGVVKRIYPLTSMQQGMLFNILLDSEEKVYFEQTVISLRGKLDVAIFEKSFNMLIQRHDTLRTNFIYEKMESPRQFVLKECQTKVYFEDIADLKAEEKERYIREFIQKDEERGFNLTKDILIRVSVLKRDLEEYTIVWSFHHILMDGWCLGIIMKEFFNIYQSLRHNRSIKLEKVSPYSEYMKWLEKQDREEASTYWRNYLEGYTQPQLLPKIASGGKEGIRQELVFMINEELTDQLSGIAKNSHVTLNTIFQTIWGIMLQKYNSTSDVVFGSVVSGRPSEISGVEKMVGLFMNTIPVRIKCDKTESFLSLIKRAQQTSLLSEKYDYFSLADIQSDSGLKPGLIDHMIAFENYPVDKEIGDSNSGQETEFVIDRVELFEHIQADLAIIVGPGSELKVKLNYNTLVMDKGFVMRIEEYLDKIIKKIAEDPNVVIKDIEIMDESEKERIIAELERDEEAIQIEFDF